MPDVFGYCQFLRHENRLLKTLRLIFSKWLFNMIQQQDDFHQNTVLLNSSVMFLALVQAVGIR